VQDTGKNVMLVSQRMRDEAIETLAPLVNNLRDNARASAELGILTTALRKSEFRYVFDPENSQRLISTNVAKLMAKENVDVDTAIEMLAVAGGKPRIPHSLTIQSDAVSDFLRAHTRINSTRQDKLTTLHNAAGLVRNSQQMNVIYVPPVNTVKYPYHAFVRTKEQVGIASEVTMLTAKSEDQLRQMAGQIDGQKYDVFYKKDTEMYFKAKGEYDYEMTVNESRINSDLARTGKLADYFPETKLENIMQDYLEFHSKQSERLVRTAVQVKNRQFFSEMQFLSDNYRTVSESVARGVGSLFRAKVDDPFGDYIKTALNISKQQEFPLLDSLNEFVDKVGLRAGDALAKARDDAQKGVIPWQEADAIADKFGLGRPYASATDSIEAYIAANSTYPKNLIRESFQKANMLLANFTLRLDFANSLVNIISTPIMLGTEVQSIRSMIAKSPELAGKFAELRSVKVPGRDYAVPSTTKMLAKAIGNYHGVDKNALIARYQDIGAIKDVSKLYHEMLDDLSFDSRFSPNHWYNKVNAQVDKMANYTGNNWSEDFTRFVSADVMRQMTDPLVEAGKMTVKEQNAYMSTFVNRVQGNYVTSQRPIVFQGTTGAAVSLFQTYAFNVLQQLHRHVEAGDRKTLMMFAGLQSSVFGFNGLPFFDAVNTHLIGSYIAGNPEHKDAYNMLPAFNKELGDFMLYGTASAFPLFSGATPALYTRGDINPRHITVLPTNIVDVPAVSAGIRLADTVYNFGKNVVNGVDLSTAMLQGLEHQGVNRPLAGFAQLLAGRSTTSQGSLISAANDMQATTWLGSLAERTVEYGGVARLLGARPMDEAVALNALYRNKTYEALDKARLANLGRTVKASLYAGESPTSEELDDFMLRYARSGGRIENFSQSMQRWMKDANVSVVNQTAQKLRSPYAQKLQQIMGGEQLPDYVNSLPDIAE
jgi:Fe-S cluster assembly scaffold protein SufB